jgi:hypothetical protein
MVFGKREASMRKYFLFPVLLFLCPFVALGQIAQEITSLQNRAFQTDLASGATLRLHLHDGDFRVVGSDSDKISIHVEGKNLERADHIKINLKRSNNGVELKLSHVPKSQLQVMIEIPKSTNLYARMRGGDLSILGIMGDKDLELTGGDLTVQVGNPQDYSHIDLSVRYGDISGSQFGVPKGMVGNSLRKDGTGKYKLHAHVMAGDLVLKT